MSARRVQRVAHAIRAIVAEAIQTQLSDPRVEPLTSITRVEVSPDLSVAHVHVSIMAPPARQRLTVAALEHAAGRMRSLVGAQIALRQAPQIRFHLDTALQKGLKTIAILDGLMAESAAAAKSAERGDATTGDATTGDAPDEGDADAQPGIEPGHSPNREDS